MKELKNWFREMKERRELKQEIMNENLSFSTIMKFYRVLALNDINENDPFACKLGMQSNNCFQITIGRQGGFTQEPELKINLIVARSSSIRLECIYTTSKTNSYTQNATFEEKIGIDYIRDDKPNDYIDTANRIDTIRKVICNSMLYTIRNYIKRWY